MPAPNNRLTELLDQVRAEFDNQQNRTGEYEQQSKFACLVMSKLSRLSDILVMHTPMPLFKMILIVVENCCNLSLLMG